MTVHQRFDPLHLFGPSFNDDYVIGFYQGMLYMTENYCMVPNDGESARMLVMRLRSHPDFPFHRASIPISVPGKAVQNPLHLPWSGGPEP